LRAGWGKGELNFLTEKGGETKRIWGEKKSFSLPLPSPVLSEIERSGLISTKEGDKKHSRLKKPRPTMKR